MKDKPVGSNTQDNFTYNQEATNTSAVEFNEEDYARLVLERDEDA